MQGQRALPMHARPSIRIPAGHVIMHALLLKFPILVYFEFEMCKTNQENGIKMTLSIYGVALTVGSPVQWCMYAGASVEYF